MALNKKVENWKRAIIVLHEIYGVNEFIQEQCQKFRETGYDVFCLNMIDKPPFPYEKSEEAYDFFRKNIGFEVYKKVSTSVSKLKEKMVNLIFQKYKGALLCQINSRWNFSASKYPASFTAFDILYYDGRQITDLPLMERKKLLKKAVNENSKISVSRYIENDGKAFYKLAEKNDLEGIVAKRKDSKYYIGKRTKDWIKIKNLKDDDYIICGYIKRENGVASLILGQYSDKKIEYKGHVIIGLLSEDFGRIENTEKTEKPAFLAMDNDNFIWIKSALTCTVEYMKKTKSGGLRQPVFKGLRDDKAPEECTVKLI